MAKVFVCDIKRKSAFSWSHRLKHWLIQLNAEIKSSPCILLVHLLLTLIIIKYHRSAFSHQKFIIRTIVIFSFVVVFFDGDFLRIFWLLVVLIDNPHPNSLHTLVFRESSIHLKFYQTIFVGFRELFLNGHMPTVSLLIWILNVLTREILVRVTPHKFY